MKKVTIQDIADALGISRNTVSKAINNSEGLADATRERILQKAVEMGYKQFSYVASLSGSGIPRPVPADPLEPPAASGEIALFTTNFSIQPSRSTPSPFPCWTDSSRSWPCWAIPSICIRWTARI